MTEDEKNEILSKLISFLNTCISASNTIELKDSAIDASFRDYMIKDTASAISFILNKINLLGMCKKQQFGYGKVKDAPFVYEYVFNLKAQPDSMGCLAFHKNPRNKAKIRILIKSLHKDYQNVIPYMNNKEIEIEWFTKEQINKLPACKGEFENEMSCM